MIALSFIFVALVRAQSSYISIKNIHISPGVVDLSLSNKEIHITATLSSVYGVASASAIIQKDKKQIAILSLYNDGKHNDGNANDELWGAGYADISESGAYSVSIMASNKKGEQIRSSLYFFEAQRPVQTPSVQALVTSKQQQLPPQFSAQPLRSSLSSSLTTLKPQQRKEPSRIPVPAPQRMQEKNQARATFEQSAHQKAIVSAKSVTAKLTTMGAAKNRDISKRSYGVQNLQSQATPIYSSGDGEKKLNIVIAGNQDEFTDSELYALARYISDHGFQMYSPFRENMSRINIYTTKYSDTMIVDPIQTAACALKSGDEKSSCILALYGEGVRQSLGVEYALILSKHFFRSFSTADFPFVGHVGFVSLVDMQKNGEEKLPLFSSDTSTWKDYQYSQMTATAMHEFGHAFGNLSDEYTEKNKGDWRMASNCIGTEHAYSFWDHTAYEALLQSWIDVQGQLDWSYTDTGWAPVRVGKFPGCSYIEDNFRSTENSLMNSGNYLQRNFDSALLQYIHLPFGWTNRTLLQDKLNAYTDGWVDSGCGDVGQKPCGYSSYTANNGTLCYKNSAFLSKDASGNPVCSACGMLGASRCETIWGINNDFSYDMKLSRCPEGTFLSYGKCIPNCGIPGLDWCSEGTEGAIAGCKEPYEPKTYDIGQSCEPCPSERTYRNGACMACGRNGQPACGNNTSETISNSGCFQPFANDGLTNWKDCAIPITGKMRIEENDRLQAECAEDNKISLSKGTCIACGHEGQQMCPISLHGTIWGCFPPYVRNSQDRCVACDAAANGYYNDGVCNYCGTAGSTSCTYNQESVNMHDGCIAPSINVDRLAQSQCARGDISCFSKTHSIAPGVSKCTRCPSGTIFDDAGTDPHCAPCGVSGTQKCSAETRGTIRGCFAPNIVKQNIFCPKNNTKCIEDFCQKPVSSKKKYSSCVSYITSDFCYPCPIGQMNTNTIYDNGVCVPCGYPDKKICTDKDNSEIGLKNGCFSPSVNAGGGQCRICGHNKEKACSIDAPETVMGCFAPFIRNAQWQCDTCQEGEVYSAGKCVVCGHRNEKACPLINAPGYQASDACYTPFKNKLFITESIVNGSPRGRYDDISNGYCIASCPPGTVQHTFKSACINPCAPDKLPNEEGKCTFACGKLGQPACIGDEVYGKVRGCLPPFTNTSGVCRCLEGLRPTSGGGCRR